MQFSRHVRNIAIKQALVLILGHVYDAGCLVYRGGFVFEPAHRRDRSWRDEACFVCRYLENVAVRLLTNDVAAFTASVKTFFAGQPRSPGCRAACAVEFGTRETQVLSFSVAAGRVMIVVVVPPAPGVLP